MQKVNRRRTPSDGKSSHCLWQGELKKKHDVKKYFPFQIWWSVTKCIDTIFPLMLVM
jgi:hypothetical protein